MSDDVNPLTHIQNSLGNCIGYNKEEQMISETEPCQTITELNLFCVYFLNP